MMEPANDNRTEEMEFLLLAAKRALEELYDEHPELTTEQNTPHLLSKFIVATA